MAASFSTEATDLKDYPDEPTGAGLTMEGQASVNPEDGVFSEKRGTLQNEEADVEVDPESGAQIEHGAEPGSPTATAPDSPEDESEYPASWRLGLITIALCLAVFCMALVWQT